MMLSRRLMQRSTFSRYVNYDGDAQIAGKRALYNNLNQNEELALRIDETVKERRPDGWRGNQPKENTIKAAILPLLGNDVAEVERIFLIIKAHSEY
jgi:type I restriction enzyme R subunit